MPATIKDIRKRTGLSLATISKYLNGGNVLPENREKIEKAVKELNYEVNEIARGLVTKRTNTIGVVVFDIANGFAGRILHYLGQDLRVQGYGILICDSANNEEQEAENIRFLISKKVDGIICLPVSRRSDFLKPAKERGIPAVLVDRYVEDGGYDGVILDNEGTAEQLVNTLLAHGHRKIAVIGTESTFSGSGRYAGFCRALEKAGVEIPDAYRKIGIWSIEYGYDSMEELMKLEDRPTAVMASNYETCLGAVIALNRMGISFPEDVSLISFDNQMLTDVVRPKIQVAEQPTEQMSRMAADLLMKRITEKEEYPPVRLTIAAQMHEGYSVGDIG